MRFGGSMARAVNRSHWGLSVRWPGGVCPGRAGERDGVQAAGPGADPLPGPSGGVPGDRVRRRSRAARWQGLPVLLALDLLRHSHRAPPPSPPQTLRRDARTASAGKPEFWLACSRQQRVTHQSRSPRARLHNRAHGPNFFTRSRRPRRGYKGLHDIASTPVLPGQYGKRTAGEGYAKLP
jgi:hypothetical protein